VLQLEHSEKQRSPDNQKLYEECLERSEEARDRHKCEISLNMCGLRVHSILLDSGAMSNVISMGCICALASLSKGGGFRTALRTCRFRSVEGKESVAGLGGHTMAVQGTLLLPIDIKGVTYKMPFTLINSPVRSLIIGTPGLRMLKFSLYSPLFGKINYLKHPSLRNKIDKSAEDQDDSDTEQEEQKAKVLRKQQPAPDATTASDREVEI
jgi:hypothetical protein